MASSPVPSPPPTICRINGQRNNGHRNNGHRIRMSFTGL
jgi:hypothetical protein